MAKKQKVKHKTDLKNESVETESDIDVEDSSKEGIDSSIDSIEENPEIPSAEEKIKAKSY